MRTLLTITFLILSKSLISQTLISDAVKIKTAYERLSADTGSKKLKQNYITVFPPDTKRFLNVFQTKNFDQLYKDSYKYLNVLEKCAATFPKEVISKCVDIGKNLVWDADAVGQLQHISVAMAVKHLRVFIDKYKTLSSKEQDSLISFYADVENHKAYLEYQNLIDKLKSVNQTDISKKMENARARRKKLSNH